MGYTLNKEGGNKCFALLLGLIWQVMYLPLMPHPKEILNELKWRKDKNLEKAEIWYVHRGAPNDSMIISGGDITNLTHSFMELADSSIPFHRIFKIIYEGEIIFERTKK
jgi:uncharacterized protein (UPF0248 family)